MDIQYVPNPRILCLHGRGSSSQIFELQARRLDQLLAPHFEFVYLDGLHVCNPGPGILPVFEDMAPYFQWVQPEVYNEFADWEQIQRKVNAAVALGGPFVGVLGFSQGAKVAAGLLQYDQNFKTIGLQFGILASGGYPPLGVERNGIDPEQRIKLPTIHVHGLSDPYRSENLELYRRGCEENTAQVFEFEGGHHLPLQISENERLAEIIRKTYDNIQSGGDGTGESLEPYPSRY